MLLNNLRIGVLAALSLAAVAPSQAQPRDIDTSKSTVTVHVYKSGMLSALGHDHQISAPISGGTVDAKAHKVALHFATRTLHVDDAKSSEKDRGQVQANMLGPDVLDAENHKEISFESTGVTAAGAGVWKVTGNLNLHGQSRPVSMEVHETDGRYTGTCRFKITEFGIKPVKAAGGTVSVKDEVQLDFDIQLAR
jgi:polyisoprenoid-binding protein YceI